MTRLTVQRAPRMLGAAGALLLAGGLLMAAGPTADRGISLGSLTGSSTDSLPRDPALVVGTLPNGLRYYIRAHRTPAQRAALRLAVNAGSVQEDDDQQGFAHFVEHMAFNGTTHFPRHELISTLQLAGMRFGADINAYTSYDETVYMLEVPTDQPTSLQQGLTMLEDWAGGGMLIDSAEVVAERGVVMGEWRYRTTDTTVQAIQDRSFGALVGDSRYRMRQPIGQTKLIETAQPEPVRRFYRDWYRPDLMAVIAVGDFDPKQVEREIKARFGKIPVPANPRPRVSYRVSSRAKPVVDIFRAPITPGINVIWKRPARVVETRAAYRQALVAQLLFGTLQLRLQQLAVQPRRPFIDAAIGTGAASVRPMEMYQLALVAWPTDSLERGLAAALTEIERVAQHGVSEPVLARRKAALARQLESAAAQSTVVPSETYAQAYTRHYLAGGVLWSPAQELTVARELLATITPADLAEAAKFWRSGSDRVTLVPFPTFAHERMPTEAGIAAIFDSVAQLRLAPDSTAGASDAPLLATRPRPGRVTSERQHQTAGITEWTLSNGARVLFKPTANDPDEVLIRAVSPGGWSLLPDTLLFSPGRLVAQMMTQAAGLGKSDRQALGEQLATSVVRDFAVELTPYQEGLRLGGSPRDLETLFQLLHLTFTAPKLDTAAVGLWQRRGNLNGSNSGDNELAYYLSGGNPRLAPPAQALMALADTGRAMAVFRDRFGNAADFTFIIVGAATPAQVKPLVERYVANLPSTGAREKAPDLGVRPLEQRLASTREVFNVPRAVANVLYAGEFPSTVEEYLNERRRLGSLELLLQMRFTDVLREQMGGTYGAGVSAWTVAVPQEQYRFAINFVAAPERVHGMLDTTFAILDSVRGQRASELDLRRVAAMQRRTWETELQRNRYWLETMELFDRLKIPFARIVEPPKPTTPEEIRTAAQRYLPREAYVNNVFMPTDSALYTTHDTAASERVKGEFPRQRR